MQFMELTNIPYDAVMSLGKFYTCSILYKLQFSFLAGMRNSYKNSFLHRGLSAIIEKDIARLLTFSLSMRYLAGLYRRLPDNISSNFKMGFRQKAILEFRRGFFAFPVKFIGLILLSKALTELFFSLTLKADLEQFSPGRTVFLAAIGFGYIFSAADWPEIEKTSFVIRIIKGR